MKYKPCSKCGAIHWKGSKHTACVRNGFAWCGHCGTKLERTEK